MISISVAKILKCINMKKKGISTSLENVRQLHGKALGRDDNDAEYSNIAQD